MLSKFRPLVIGDCIAIAAILTTTVLLDKSATRRSAQTIAEAATYIDDLQSVESNQTVTQLDDLLVEMGIGITGEAAQGDSGGNDNFELVKSLQDYFGDEILLLAAQATAAPPELVGSYLLEKGESLERVKDLLLAMPAPVWGFDVEAVQDIDYAFLSHQNTLAIHQLLLTQAIEHWQRGEEQAAQGYLQAAWKIHDGMVAGPFVLDQLLGYAMGKSQLMVARFMPFLEASGQLELETPDYFEKVHASFVLDDWLFSNNLLKRLESNVSFAGDLWSNEGAVIPVFSAMPIMRWALSERAQKAQENFERVPQYWRCKVNDMPIVEMSAWNPFNLLYSFSKTSYNRAAATMLSAELNGLVAEAQQHFADTNSWPDTLDNLESAVCEGEYWRYEKSSDGITISYDGEELWHHADGVAGITLVYREKAAN